MELVTRAECYTKGEESNSEKKARDAKERVSNARISHRQRKSKYISAIKDKIAFKMIGKVTKNFTPLNTRCEQIWHEELHLHNNLTLSAPMADVMGSEQGRWFKFYKVKGYHTEECYQLQKETERLIVYCEI